MTQKYYSLMTNRGIEYINEQVLQGSNTILATGWYIKLGNSTTAPTAEMIDLNNVIYTKTAVDYPQITFGHNSDGHYAEMLLPDSLTGQIIREAGLFNANDELIAVAKTHIDLSQNGDGLEMSVKQRIYISAVPASITVIYTPQADLITESDLSLALTAYEPIAKVISKGSASLPVYFDSNGEAKTITSYQGHSHSAQYAVTAQCDMQGRTIDTTYATRDLGGLTADGNDFINQSKAMITGLPSDNATVYADILSCLHSSFDLSKFTVTGSPTITDNGILTGFNSLNYINNGAIYSEAFDKSVVRGRIKIIANPTNLSGQNDFLNLGGNISLYNTFNANGTGIGFLAASYSTLYNQGELSLNDVIDYVVTIDNTSLKVTVNTLKNGVADKSVSQTLSAARNLVNYSTYRGLSLNNSAWEVDLKYTEVYVDGSLILTGNKTGSDTYTIGGNTVTIPYTVTKGGAKIAEAESLNDIKAVYNNGFVANQYFTIDKLAKTFTLPQGMSVYEGIANNTALIKANTADIALKADKTAVTTMVMPDYANGIAISANADFSAPDNGFISFVPINNTSDAGSISVEISGRIEIGGYTVLQATYIYGFDHSHVDSGFFVVSKNQTVFHTMSAGTVYFYPCKGDV